MIIFTFYATNWYGDASMQLYSRTNSLDNQLAKPVRQSIASDVRTSAACAGPPAPLLSATEDQSPSGAAPNSY